MTAHRAKDPRWRRRKEARPAEIVASALACFAERGFAATRLEEIAQRAGVTKGTLYLYFPNKEELFKAVVRQSLVPLLARNEEVIAASTLPTPMLLRQLILAFPQVLLNNPASALPKLILSEARNFPDLAQFYLEEVVRRGRRMVRGLIQRGIDRGEFRKVDADHAFYSVMAPFVLTALWMHSFAPFDKGGLDPQALALVHADVMLRGLAAPDGPS
jgi:AcrR family transcriptional regulator